MSALLEVRALSVSYGGFRALSDVSITVPRGSVVALLGPNGAGKSTLLRAISGLARPSSGTITLEGRRIDGSGPSRIARLGICHVPEGRGVFPSLSVRENLMLAAGRAKAGRLDRVVRTFPGLAGRLEQPAGTLSGGQQQMVGLARALVTDAPLLLLDEVSLGLAPVLVDELYRAIEALHAEGRTVLLVEQYAERALALADIAYVLALGRVAFAGQPAELAARSTLAGSYLGRL